MRAPHLFARVAVFISASVWSGAALAQQDTRFTLVVEQSLILIDPTRPSNVIRFSGSWPSYYCPPRVLRQGVDPQTREIFIDLQGRGPCNLTVATWSAEVDIGQLPGDYVARVRVLEGESGFVRHDQSVQFPAYLPYSFLLVSGITLSVSSKVAGAEQFLLITHYGERCGLTIRYEVSRRDQSISVGLFEESLIVLCPAVAPDPGHRRTLIPLGRLETGRYSVVAQARVFGSTTQLFEGTLDVTQPAATPASATGMWYTPSESGWGISMIESGNTVFATLFVHDNGKPYWLVVPNAKREGVYISGDVFESSGRDFKFRWDAQSAQIRPIGRAHIALEGQDAATLLLTVGDSDLFSRSGNIIFHKRISRLRF